MGKMVYLILRRINRGHLTLPLTSGQFKIWIDKFGKLSQTGTVLAYSSEQQRWSCESLHPWFKCWDSRSYRKQKYCPFLKLDSTPKSIGILYIFGEGWKNKQFGVNPGSIRISSSNFILVLGIIFFSFQVSENKVDQICKSLLGGSYHNFVNLGFEV